MLLNTILINTNFEIHFKENFKNKNTFILYSKWKIIYLTMKILVRDMTAVLLVVYVSGIFGKI